MEVDKLAVMINCPTTGKPVKTRHFDEQSLIPKRHNSRPRGQVSALRHGSHLEQEGRASCRRAALNCWEAAAQSFPVFLSTHCSDIQTLPST